jgi:superfamily II DNA or RNA helicase
MELALRKYQSECVDAIWAEIKINKSALVSLPCGCGKTQIIIGLIKKSLDLYPQFKCAFIVNQKNLLEQTTKRTQNYLGDIVGRFFGKQKTLAYPVTVATIQSIHKKEIFLNALIIDEAQLFNEGDGSYSDFINRCIAVNPKIKIIACTATPWRSSGKIYGEV